MKPRQPSLPLLAGRKPVLEALQQGVAIEKIFLLRSATGPEINTIKKLARDGNIPVSQVPVEKLDGLTRIQHQGVVAWGSLLHYVDLQAGISHVVEAGKTPHSLPMVTWSGISRLPTSSRLPSRSRRTTTSTLFAT